MHPYRCPIRWCCYYVYLIDVLLCVSYPYYKDGVGLAWIRLLLLVCYPIINFIFPAFAVAIIIGTA